MEKHKNNKLKKIRQKIDNLDRKILKLLAKRFDYSRLISGLKQGKNITDPNREIQLSNKWQNQSIKLGINSSCSNKILDTILEESKNIQKNTL